ncbi:ATP-binding protein [Spirochaetia bacterium 38H-sp]|uniref:histidine kinase n=1 Tax=Rarispira pelagica TaxID=3141764 RepID=A0ABU9UC65_9SPIR
MKPDNRKSSVSYGNLLFIFAFSLVISILVTIFIGISETAKNIDIQKKQALAFASSLGIVLEKRQDASAPLNFFSGAYFKYKILSDKESGIPSDLPYAWYDRGLIKVASNIYNSSQVLLLELPLINPFPYSAILIPLMLNSLISFLFIFYLLIRQKTFVEEISKRIKAPHPPLLSTGSGFFSPFIRIIAPLEQAALERIIKTDSKLDRTRAKLEVYELITEHMEEGIILADEKLRVSYANPAALKMCGIKESATGKPVGMLIKNNSLIEKILRCYENKKGARYEYCPDGERYQEISISPISLNREENSAIIVIRDISSIKKLQKIRKDFVSNVSHELKTPISSIIGYTETLAEIISPEDSTARRFAETIHNNAVRLGNIVEDLLMLSRIEQNNTEIKKAPHSLSELIQKAIDTINNAAEEKGITISTVEKPDITIMANPGLMIQALGNILDNAVRYCPAGTTVTIDWQEEADISRIIIRDNGPGIPQKDLSRIFERFYRVESSRNRNTGGTGLGLAIVKHIVESHGGGIEAESPPTGGTQFVIRLKK